MLDFYTGSQGTEFIYSLIFGECYSRFMKPELIKILQFPQKEFYTLKLSVVHWFVNKGKNESLERPRESMAKYGDEMTTYCFRFVAALQQRILLNGFVWETSVIIPASRKLLSVELRSYLPTQLSNVRRLPIRRTSSRC